MEHRARYGFPCFAVLPWQDRDGEEKVFSGFLCLSPADTARSAGSGVVFRPQTAGKRQRGMPVSWRVLPACGER